MILYGRVDLGIVGEVRSNFRVKLKSLISSVKVMIPDWGERIVTGFLKSQLLFVQWSHIISIILEINRINVSLPCNARLLQRAYWVPGPRSLWHIGIAIEGNANQKAWIDPAKCIVSQLNFLNFSLNSNLKVTLNLPKTKVCQNFSPLSFPYWKWHYLHKMHPNNLIY